jgi:hypothetical protein
MAFSRNGDILWVKAFSFSPAVTDGFVGDLLDPREVRRKNEAIYWIVSFDAGDVCGCGERPVYNHYLLGR